MSSVENEPTDWVQNYSCWVILCYNRYNDTSTSKLDVQGVQPKTVVKSRFISCTLALHVTLCI